MPIVCPAIEMEISLKHFQEFVASCAVSSDHQLQPQGRFQIQIRTISSCHTLPLFYKTHSDLLDGAYSLISLKEAILRVFLRLIKESLSHTKKIYVDG